LVVLKLKLIAVGASTGTVFPEDLLARLTVAQGDTLLATETPSGYLLTPYDPAVEGQLEMGRAFMKEYRKTFRGLA
jgi:hypothetical protein